MRCPIESGEGQLLLDRVRSASLGDHIRDCPACREFAAARRSVDSALDLWDAPPVSADFDRRLYRRIQKDVRWWDVLVRHLHPPSTSRILPVATAAGLLLAAGLWIERPEPSPHSAVIEALPAEQAEHALQDMETMQEFSRIVRADPAEPRM
jgi:hypothetical protein